MKRKILVSLTTALMVATANVAGAAPNGWGIVVPSPSEHTPVCCDPISPVCPSPPCSDVIPGVGVLVSVWLDPGMIIASGLDLLATKSQDERIIDCQDALDELEDALGGSCSGSGSSGTTTSLSGEDSVVVAPDVVVKATTEADPFTTTRQEVEKYLFYSDSCKEDCVLERQNTWLLNSIEMAAAAGDKLLAKSQDMSGDYSDLQTDFNGQTSPQGMWGSSSKITLHTHVQQNDINALYARDLEMNALNGVRELDDVRFISR